MNRPLSFENRLTEAAISLTITPMRRVIGLTLFLIGWNLSALAPAHAQTIGVVTALQGRAELTRAGNRTGLRFRDGLILRDSVDTREQSLVRILFGGKSTVTVRELSHLDVREELLPGGGARTVHQLSAGEVLMRVVRQLLNTGDEAQIQTPNAVAAVRGTTLYARYIPELGQATFTVINGLAVITPLGLPAFDLPTGSSVTISGTPATGISVGPIRAISQSEAAKILDDAEVTPPFRQEASRGEIVRDLGARAAQEPLLAGTPDCWPYAVCESQTSAAGALIHVPVPVPSGTATGSRGGSGVRGYVFLASGSGKIP